MRRHFFIARPSSSCSSSLLSVFPLASQRRAATTTASPAVEDRIASLESTIQKQQTALQAMAKKVVTAAAAANTLEELQRKITELDNRAKEQDATIAELRSRLESANTKAAASGGSSNNKSTASASSSLDLAEIRNRISALESRQAILKISQRPQQLPSPLGGASSSSSARTATVDLVSMEPGVDGTPRLVTTQVRVFHPTASAAQIRQLMEGAGPVVSCLRKPGEAATRAHGHHNKQNHPNSNNNRGSNSNSNNSSSSSEPCFVVTFQSTSDAVRAIENLSGMSLVGHKVRVEPHVLPEQTVVVSSSSSSSSSSSISLAAADDGENADEGLDAHHGGDSAVDEQLQEV